MLAIVAASMMFSGCFTEPKIESTKTWEGHYFTVDEFNEHTSSIQLDENESIWIMSNHTLNRLLKNAGR